MLNTDQLQQTVQNTEQIVFPGVSIFQIDLNDSPFEDYPTEHVYDETSHQTNRNDSELRLFVYLFVSFIQLFSPLIQMIQSLWTLMKFKKR